MDTAREKFLFRVTPAARSFLLREGTDPKYGARHLKRAIERHIVYPLANLLSTGQIRLGDMLCIDWGERDQRLLFEKEGQTAVLPIVAPAIMAASVQAAGAVGSKPAEEPSPVAARDAN